MEINENVYCLIMAGGVGNRFWPVSNRSCPKQFSDILNTGKSSIRQTFERINRIIPVERIYIATGKEFEDLTKQHIPELPESNLLKEPCRRSTATCIMYAAMKIYKTDKNATMVVLPSDHFISNDFQYLDNICKGVEFVENNGSLLTIGIKPVRVETQYGYIQTKGNNGDQISRVKTFTEKPDADMARTFFESGDFLWNAGIFIWKAGDLIREVKKHIYDLYVLFKDDKKLNTDEEQDFIDSIYGECPYISIDFGILERSSNVNVLKGDFGWSDMGTWHVYQELCSKDEHNNVDTFSNTWFQNSSDCIVNIPSGKKAVLCGVQNLIVAERENILMVCNKEYEEQIKLFDQQITKNN